MLGCSGTVIVKPGVLQGVPGRSSPGGCPLGQGSCWPARCALERREGEGQSGTGEGQGEARRGAEAAPETGRRQPRRPGGPCPPTGEARLPAFPRTQGGPRKGRSLSLHAARLSPWPPSLPRARRSGRGGRCEELRAWREGKAWGGALVPVAGNCG